MKKWLCPVLGLIALGLLTRLPHPSRDVAKLEPVRAVYLFMERGRLNIETDTGDSGSGRSLPEAAARMKADADQEIFLDTAEFLILDPAVPITEGFFALLRPSCKVAFSTEPPDVKTVSDYLAVHPPETTLAHLRASTLQ